MESKGKSIIFCQSAIKVSAVLVCYEYERSKGHDVVIVVRNVKTIFEFIKSLHLEAEVKWFENYSCDICHVIRKNKMDEFIRCQLAELSITNDSLACVYFTSICRDLPMCNYLSRMPKEKIVKIQGALDISNGIDEFNVPHVNYSLKWKLKRIFFSYFLEYKLRLQTVVTPALAIDIGYYRYPLFDGSDISICDKYQYTPKMEKGKKALVFASEYVDIFKDRNDYVNVFVSCVRYLKEKGYIVYLKGHPRIGTLDEATKVADNEIPSYIPAEFINYTSFDCAFGLTSSAICSSSFHVASYSLLPLTKLVDDVRYSDWCVYLDKTSNGHVRYLHSFDDIN